MQLSCQGVLDPLRKGEMECYVNCDSELVRYFGRIWPTFCTDYIVATMVFSKSKLPNTKIRNIKKRSNKKRRHVTILFFRCIASILRYPRNVDIADPPLRCSAVSTNLTFGAIFLAAGSIGTKLGKAWLMG